MACVQDSDAYYLGGANQQGLNYPDYIVHRWVTIWTVEGCNLQKTKNILGVTWSNIRILNANPRTQPLREILCYSCTFQGAIGEVVNISVFMDNAVKTISCKLSQEGTAVMRIIEGRCDYENLQPTVSCNYHSRSFKVSKYTSTLVLFHKFLCGCGFVLTIWCLLSCHQSRNKKATKGPFLYVIVFESYEKLIMELRVLRI